MPFIGSINAKLRAFFFTHAKLLAGRRCFIGCSGNFTIEQILTRVAPTAELYSNDVSLYSGVIGAALTKSPFPLRCMLPEMDWLNAYLEDDATDDGTTTVYHPGPRTVAAIVLFLEMLNYEKRKNDYAKSMWNNYVNNWKTLHERTLAKVKVALDHTKIASYTTSDVHDYYPCASSEDIAIGFLPTYCLAPDHRILTADLRWIPAGDIGIGQQLLAFDEYPSPYRRCRCWQISTVLQSHPSRKECVRVNLENGESIICTTDHPWLTAHYAYTKHGPQSHKWTAAMHLGMNNAYVIKPLTPWQTDSSYEAGWIAGMFDGEGSARWQGLVFVQKPGPTMDRMSSALSKRGITFSINPRRDGSAHVLEVNGGVPGHLSFLGTFLPERLISQLIADQPKTIRTQQNTLVKIKSIQLAGLQDVQSISTSSRTYIGEGYFMHNTGGYERMFKPLEESFSWPRPTYQMLTEERREATIQKMISTDYVLYDDRPRDLPCVARVDLFGHRTVYVYSNLSLGAGVFRKTLNEKVLTFDLLGIDEEISPSAIIAVKEIPEPYINHYRNMYLSKHIQPGSGGPCYLVFADKKLFGFLIFNAYSRMGKKGDLYMLSDFVVPSTRYTRLAKLLLMVTQCQDTKRILEERLLSRREKIYTTAFTDKPVSMKYRGIYELAKRGKGFLNYTTKFNDTTFQEVVGLWMKKYKQR